MAYLNSRCARPKEQERSRYDPDHGTKHPSGYRVRNVRDGHADGTEEGHKVFQESRCGPWHRKPACCLGGLIGFTPTAFVHDLRFNIRNAKHFKKKAVVNDSVLLKLATNALGPLLGMKHFELKEIERAWYYVTS